MRGEQSVQALTGSSDWRDGGDRASWSSGRRKNKHMTKHVRGALVPAGVRSTWGDLRGVFGARKRDLGMVEGYAR